MKTKSYLHHGCMISPLVTLRIIKTMKRNPLKVHSARNFYSTPSVVKRHMKLLEELGIIEIVPMIYINGNKKIQVKKEVKGYKLKLNEVKDGKRL
jgi:hypothetical protein